MSHTLSMLAQDRQVELLREAEQFRRDRPTPAQGALDARHLARLAASLRLGLAALVTHRSRRTPVIR